MADAVGQAAGDGPVGAAVASAALAAEEAAVVAPAADGKMNLYERICDRRFKN